MKTTSLVRDLLHFASRLFPTDSGSRVARPQTVRGFSRPEPLEERFVLSSFLVTNLNNGGPGSLRAAVFNANATPAADSISFHAGLAGTLVLAGAELHITAPVTITGPGSNLVKISGNNAFRVFEIDANKTVSISGLDITRGLAPTTEAGGGILNHGLLTLTNVILDSNAVTGTGAHGGAIDNSGTGAKLTLIASKVINNKANEGGGIYNETGSIATIVRSVVSNNQGASSGDGAGIRNDGDLSIRLSILSDNVGNGNAFFGGAIRNGGSLSIVASTIANNISQGRAGAIYSTGTLSIINSTIVNNVALGSAGGGGIFLAQGSLTISGGTITGNIDGSGAATGGGGVVNSAATLVLNNTVIAGNFATGGNPPDVRGAVSGSGNFIGIGDANLTGITTATNGNQIGTIAGPLDPKLGPLQYNGGVTPTRLPLLGSPLLGTGVNAVVPAGVTTDQRGLPRIHGANVDIGATEF